MHAPDSLGRIYCDMHSAILSNSVQNCAKLYKIEQYRNIRCNIEQTAAAAAEKLNPDFPRRRFFYYWPRRFNKAANPEEAAELGGKSSYSYLSLELRGNCQN